MERCTVLLWYTEVHGSRSVSVAFVGCAYGANKTQHIDLEVAQPLNQAFGRSIDFHHTLNDFSGVQR